MSKLALVRIGYAQYAVPVAKLATIVGSGLRKVESKYESGSGYLYWYSKEGADDLNVIVLDAQRILSEKPTETTEVEVKTPKAMPALDNRVIAAPSDTPISIKSVPPMREFVDEWRDEPSPAVEAL